MNASTQRPVVLDSFFLRWCAHASAAALVVIWLAFLLAESLSFRLESPLSKEAIYQAAILMVVFAGYAIGWRNELAGGVLAILGTVVYFAINLITLEVFPETALAWFAAPGVLYVSAWYVDRLSGAARARQR